MYILLSRLNKIIGKFSCEIRKKPSFFGYYLQRYDTVPKWILSENGVFTVPIEKLRSPHFFSYAPCGWHYYTETLKQFVENPALSLKESILYSYYQTFKPHTLYDVFTLLCPGLDVDKMMRSLPALALRDFWTLDGSPKEIAFNFISEESQLFGPISDRYSEEQMIRCVTAYKLIKKHGYIPEKFEDGYLGGFFLVKGDDYRFVVMSGKHRLAALSLLGYSQIKVRCAYKLKILDIEKIDNWPTIKNSLFTKCFLKSLFLKSFELDGLAFAKQYGFFKDR